MVRWCTKASCPLHRDDRYRAAAKGEPNVCLEDKTIIPNEYKAKYFKYFKQLYLSDYKRP